MSKSVAAIFGGVLIASTFLLTVAPLAAQDEIYCRTVHAYGGYSGIRNEIGLDLLCLPVASRLLEVPKNGTRRVVIDLREYRRWAGMQEEDEVDLQVFMADTSGIDSYGSVMVEAWQHQQRDIGGRIIGGQQFRLHYNNALVNGVLVLYAYSDSDYFGLNISAGQNVDESFEIFVAVRPDRQPLFSMQPHGALSGSGGGGSSG